MTPMIQKYRITPLGAACVEALPDEEMANNIQKRFNERSICPTSAIFPTLKSVSDFYRAEGIPVIAVKFSHA